MKKELSYLLVAILSIVLLTGASTQLNFITQVKDGPYIDPRAFGAICDGNTSNASADTAGIQAAMDTVQYNSNGAGGGGAPYTGHVQTKVKIPVGQCIINTPLVVHKPNTILEGFGATADSGMTTGSWLVALSTFDGPMIRMSSEDIYNYSSSGQGQNTPVVRGVALRDFGINLSAAASAGHFTAHWAIEAFSTSNMPDWSNLWVLGHKAGCFLISTSTSSSVNNTMYDPEQLRIKNFFCFSNDNAPTASGIEIKGANEITIDTGVVSIGGGGTVTPSGSPASSSSVAAVEIISDNVGNFGNHVNIVNVHTTDYAVHFRVRGADLDHVKFGQFGCATHPSCTSVSVGQTPIHYGPDFIHFIDNECEAYNQCLVIRDEGNPNGYATNNASEDITFDRTNTVYFSYGSTPRIAWADFQQGGEIDAGARAGVYATQLPVFLGANTEDILSWIYFSPCCSTGVAFVNGGGNNNVQLIIGRFAFSQLPRCYSSSCSIPNTDAPYGMQVYCVDCNAAASGSTPSSGGSSGRMLVSNGSAWVGQ